MPEICRSIRFFQSVIFQDKVVHQNQTNKFGGDVRGNVLQKNIANQETSSNKEEAPEVDDANVDASNSEDS